MLELRPHQITARDQTRELFAAGRRGVIVVAPTGFGKTILAADVIRLAEQKGTRTLFMAHREELVQQCSDKLTEAGLPHGIIMAGRSMALYHKTQVASVQTIVRRMHSLTWRPKFITIDESHLSGAKTYETIVDFYGRPPIMGLTATPTRLDGRSLGINDGGLFDDMVVTIGTAELIDQGYLAPFRYFAPSRPDLSGVKTVRGDYDEHELATRIDRPTLVGDAIQTWLARAAGVSTIVFAVSIKHAEHIAEQFRAIGVTAKAVSGQTPSDERKQAMADFKSGRLTVLINCQLYVEGIDCPNIRCVMLLCPTRSVTRYLQEIGRGLRTAPGKNECVILDHAGLVFEHGLPDEHRQWSLTSTAPKRKAAAGAGASINQCPKCYRCHVPAPISPSCGHVYEVRSRIVKQVAGELAEITSGEVLDRRQQWEVGAANTREQLEALAKARGCRPGWVDMIIRGREMKKFKERVEAAKQGTLL